MRRLVALCVADQLALEEKVAQEGPRGFEQILKLAPRMALTAKSVALCVANQLANCPRTRAL